MFLEFVCFLVCCISCCLLVDGLSVSLFTHTTYLSKRTLPNNILDTIKSGIKKRHKNLVKSISSTIVSNLPLRNQHTICSINVSINYQDSLPR